MKLIKCDRCDKTITIADEAYVIQYARYDDLKTITYERDLCKHCIDRFGKFMRRENGADKD